MEWIGRPEIKCCIYNQFIVDKDANTSQYGNIKFSTSGAGTTTEWSNANKVLTPTAFIKVNSKWITGLKDLTNCRTLREKHRNTSLWSSIR